MIELKYLVQDTVDEQRKDIQNFCEMSEGQTIRMTTLIEMINECEDPVKLSDLFSRWVGFTTQFDL